VTRFGSSSQPADGADKGHAGRKRKRKWTPEPGAAQARPWQPVAKERSQRQPPPRSVFYDDEPARPYPPPPIPTADEAPTGAIPIGNPLPPRGARPYPPADRRTEPVRRERPPSGSYERYDTGGYAGEPAQTPDEPHALHTEATAGPMPGAGSIPRLPKKLTVTRVAALRGRQLTGQAVDAFQRATKADGADKSGLTSLTYAVMLNYASDAAMAIALANTLFFAATSGESKGKVALYLLITIAPFALVAPVIGPALDRIQRGRR
jgi:hypothetical protein